MKLYHVSSSGTHRRFFSRTIRTGGCLLAISIVVVATVLAYRLPILRYLGDSLVVQHTLQKADALVLLGGGGVQRASHAVRVLETVPVGRVHVLLSEPVGFDRPNEAIRSMESQLVQGVFQRAGVMSSNVSWMGYDATSTHEEFVYLRGWLERESVQSAIIVSGWHQSSRVQWCIEHLGLANDHTLMIAPAPVAEYETDTWWQHEEGWIDVQNEWGKSIYYCLYFGLWSTT